MAPPPRSWLRIAERLVGNWAPTLRASLALATAFGCVAVVLVVLFGVDGVLVSSALGIAIRTLTYR